MPHTRPFALALALLVVVTLHAAPPDPARVGGAFQVNTSPIAWSPKVELLPSGEFFVVWDAYPIRGRRLPAEGPPTDDDFPIGTTTSGTGYFSDLAVLPDGTSLVAWILYDGSSRIQSRIFLPDGAPLGDDFTVADPGTNPSVGGGSESVFLVVWETFGDSEIVGRLMDGLGNPLGPDLGFDKPGPGDRAAPFVTAAPDGTFLVAWKSDRDSDGSYENVMARRVDSAGNLLGDPFPVERDASGARFDLAVARRPDGTSLVAWAQPSGLYARLLAADGVPYGDRILVSPDGAAQRPRAAVDPNRGFLLTWTIERSAPPFNRAEARYLDSDGSLGTTFEVGIHGYDLDGSDAAIDAASRFLVVWSGDVEPFLPTVQGQRYITPIFADGFETGDTSAWRGRAIPESR